MKYTVNTWFSASKTNSPFLIGSVYVTVSFSLSSLSINDFKNKYASSYLGIIWGFIIDLLLNKKSKKENINYEICDEDHCNCHEEGVIKSTLIHTLKTLLFIMLVSFLLNILLYFIGEDNLSKLFLKNSIFGPFISSLLGLIPNCGSSIVITELYLNGAISLGSAMAGLLTGSGVALLVLFKENKDIKENVTILSLLYGLGVISGIIIELITMIF